ncbi:MAG: GNAT family N-acetyltransferase [Candidatus Thorarchaeota archaeon]
MPDIRPMKPEDWDEFHEMDLELFPDDSMEENHFKKRTENDGCFALMQDNRIIGCLIVARFGEDEAYLGRIGVSKTHQGKGFGSLLMEYAIDWYHEQGGIKATHLLTQDYNKAAQNLYKKYGFKRTGTTWSFYVPYDSVRPQKKYRCQKIQEEEIDPVGSLFPSLPPQQIRRFLSADGQLVLTLKDLNGKIKGACRFTPSFPGCFPFEITSIDCFDDFATGLMEFKLPEHDYFRVTFTDIPDLAKLCEEREYRLHHRLHKMTMTL